MTQALPRESLLTRLRAEREWDLAIIGGGCVGLGVALDAAVRGLSVVLVEAEDFAKGTSSRATKLAHGGVRYLAQGDIGLVREALHERGALLANAPHVASRLPFVMPAYHWWERGFYGAGLKAYDLLAGSQGLGGTEWLSTARARQLLPGVQAQGLQGGVRYWDGQFDDARLAVLLARTAVERGALVVNHCAVTGLQLDKGQVRGVQVQDAETAERLSLRARCVVNATGVWVDRIRDMDQEPGAPQRARMVAPSQGVHLVVDRSFLPGDHALLVPKTADGRVLFAVPWLGKVILGTTDTPRQDAPLEPQPLAEEVGFILRESARYLARAPKQADVRSVWVGMRPLVRPEGDEGANTKAISREHTVVIGSSGLVTVTGGKWTTYRSMAEDVLQRCMVRGLVPHKPGGVTARLPLIGSPTDGSRAGTPMAASPGEHLYGTEAIVLRGLAGADQWLWRDGDGGLSEAMVRFAARFEMARTVEDVLARRCRLLFLDAAEAARQADAVAAILSEELGRPISSEAFKALAAQYLHLPS